MWFSFGWPLTATLCMMPTSVIQFWVAVNGHPLYDANFTVLVLGGRWRPPFVWCQLLWFSFGLPSTASLCMIPTILKKNYSPLRMAVNGHPSLDFKFICIWTTSLMRTSTFIIFCPSIRVAVNGHPYWNFRFFWIFHFFIMCTRIFLLILSSIRVAVNGHSYFHFGFISICA